MEPMFAYARSLRLWWTASRFPLPLLWGRLSQLCRLEDLPPEQRHNPYILTGYRRCRRRADCLLSVLQCHNETVNIWSNLLALAILFALLVEDHAGGRFARLGVGLAHRALLTAMALAYAAMLLLSAVYHTFNCTAEARSWYRLDFAGVWLSVVAYVLGFTALQFRGAWRVAHLTAAILAAAPSLALAAAPRFRDQRHDAARVRAMGGFALYSLLPLAHHAAYGDPRLVGSTLSGHLTVLVLLALSLFVFVTKLPERRWPGSVDLLGSSHQIWHVGVGVCVLLAHELQLVYATSPP
ncbi:progestin and adipoQ receptor family member 3-like [Dermacentor variabilis]|uniref:progestin and adipoQ receptor family member 3-like n=1 Tax=Dermacentor variabilis TaxID=34621 RepID=UPI003F5BE94C